MESKVLFNLKKIQLNNLYKFWEEPSTAVLQKKKKKNEEM